MHTIEPYFNWRNLYIASEDERSPFFGRKYSEFECSDSIYDHFINPQWDNIGSPTLYVKILYAEYEEGFAVIELFGEWNDCLNNDIMLFKRRMIEPMMNNGIYRFLLIGENVLNFHGSDDCYYEEWMEDLAEAGQENDAGWIVLLNFRGHVLQEMERENLMRFFTCDGEFNDFPWRTYRPLQLYQKVEQMIMAWAGNGRE